LETKEKVVQFFEPLAIRVVLRNNSRSTVSLNTKNLRLVAQGWHDVGSAGAWSGRGVVKKLSRSINRLSEMERVVNEFAATV
jgi:hypothetical protein